MGTIVQGSCPACGPQNLRPADVTLRVSNRAPEMSHYEFQCRGCAGVVLKPAPPLTIAVLTSSGEIRKTYWEPMTLLERRPAAALHPLTEEEVCDAIIAFEACPAAELLDRIGAWR